jgi:osmotically-inducible protein OsmY
MTINDMIQLLTAIAAAVAGIGSVYNNIKIGQTHTKIAELETNTNSIKDALVASTRAEGFQAGQIDQASRADPSVINPSS